MKYSFEEQKGVLKYVLKVFEKLGISNLFKMKTRIKVIEYANGRKEYIPLYRSVGTWYMWRVIVSFESVYYSHCLDRVKQSVDRFLEDNRKKTKKRFPKPKVSYIKYP